MEKYKQLVMEIVGGCNAKCKYCSTGIKALRRKNIEVTRINKDDFTRELDYILDRGFFDVKNGILEFFGWEPFLHQQLNEICTEIFNILMIICLTIWTIMY